MTQAYCQRRSPRGVRPLQPARSPPHFSKMFSASYRLPASAISKLKSQLNSEISNLKFQISHCSAACRITAEARPSYFNHVSFLNGYEQAAHSQHLRSRQDVI